MYRLKKSCQKESKKGIIRIDDRIPISVEVNGLLWREFMAHCVENGVGAEEMLDELMEKYTWREWKRKRKRGC